MANKQIVFSGAQPTGSLTLGNYLGAIKNWVDMQNNYECLFCLVDMHAITIGYDPISLKQNIYINLATYIACGLDPDRSIIFNQSKVSAHAELAWIFSCITPLGWLNRMTQFKDKAGESRESASLGLYAYPVLMAADILLYKATHVPVGDDQTQHVELARDIAGAFNRRYEHEYFQLPNIVMQKIATRVMSLNDGKKKMSKSDSNDMSRINLIDDNDAIAKKLKRAKTDSISSIYYNEVNRPEISNLITIYSALRNISIEQAEIELENSNTSNFKSLVTDLLIEIIAPIRDKISMLCNDQVYLNEILNKNGIRADQMAQSNLSQIKDIVGFI